jgi:Kef-type K+ transport system membrane component KefB
MISGTPSRTGFPSVDTMKRISYYLAVASLLVGLLIVLVSLTRLGLSLTVGLLIGGLLIVNGLLRLYDGGRR